MVGTTLEFKLKAQTGTDEFNNPTGEIIGISVDDCLIAPVLAPVAAHEQQAIHQSQDRVAIHLPKTFTGSLAGAYVAWDGKIFLLDSDSVSFMDENTPGRWNRYFRAESVGQYDDNVEDIWLHFFATEDSQFVLVQETP